MSKEVLYVAGSPSPASRSSYVASVALLAVRREGLGTRSFSLRDFDPADVFHARVDAPGVKDFVAAARGAAAIVLSTPVYKGTYAGGLKAIVDLIPHDALVGRPALGIATTRAVAHEEGVEQGYRALFAFFGADALESLVLSDDEVRVENGDGSIGLEAYARVEAAARALVAAIRAR
jgi:FMN reductase